MIRVNMSNEIANMILRMLEQDGSTEIQRNDFAQRFGCVPSQINYVISSRFTPEHGYIVESRRGGGGYVKISRVSYDKGTALMHVINSIGDRNLHYQKLLSDEIAAAGLAVTSDQALHLLEPKSRDKIRASIFKHILLSTIQKGR